MKLRIELDIEPNEVELATELISTLRALSDHVKVNTTSATTRGQEPLTTRPVQSIPQATHQAPKPEDRARFQQTPATVPSKPSQPEASSIPDQKPESVDFGAKILEFQNAESKQDVSACKKIAGEIAAALPQKLDANRPDSQYESFVGILEDKLFVTRNKDNALTLETCKLLMEMPPEIMNDLKTRIISTALRHLMIKRSVYTDRTEFFAHAEVFAAMVSLEFILISGAIQTISKLMKKEETRAAAVTMLGTTTQLCSEKILTQVDDRKLAALRAALDEVTEAEMDYDKKYIQDALHWNVLSNGQGQPNGVLPPANPDAPAPNGTAAPAPKAPEKPQEKNPNLPPPTVSQAPPPSANSILKLTPQTQWTGYTQSVKGIVIDDTYKQVVTTSNDGTIRLYNTSGTELQRIDLLTHSIIDVDFNLSTRIIAGTGSQITKPGEAATSCPTYTAYQLEEGSLKLLGTKNVPNNVVSVLKLRFLAKGGTEFICAESTEEKSLVVSRYSPEDLKKGNKDENLVPLASFKTDHAMITAISAVPTSPVAFLTADRSGKIYIWDARVSKPVITLLPPEIEAAQNEGVITCLDTLDPNFVVAGTYGQGVNVWDLRLLQKGSKLEGMKPLANIPLNKEPVTRLARIPDSERQIVVAAANSILTLQLNPDGSYAGKIDGRKASPKYYWDAKWSIQNGTKILYAASAGPPAAVDIYNAIPTPVEGP